MMCSRIAIAAVAVGLSVAAAGIVVSPFGPARATGTAAPVIERIAIGAGQVGLVEGKSAPGAHVVLRANGRLFGHGVAGDNGLWRVETSRPLEAGDYRISVTSRTVGVDRDVSGDDVRVALPADGGPARAALSRIAGGNAEEQLIRAGTLAEAATKRFDEIMSKGPAKQAETRVAQADTKHAPTVSGAAAGPQPRIAEVRTPETRVAQVGAGERSAARAPGGRGEDDFLNPVWEWLERANRQYQGVIVKQLSAGEPAASLAAAAPAATPTRTAAAQSTTTPPATSTPKAPSPLSQRVGQLPLASTTNAGGANAAAPATAEKDYFEQAQEAVTDWLDRAKRQYQAVVVRRLSDPNPSESAMPSPKSVPAGISTVAVMAPTAPVAQPRAVEEAARLAEQQRREAEAKRLAEQKAKADEEARRIAAAAVAAKAKADGEAARAKADEDARRVAAAAAAKAKADAVARARAEADAKARAEADAKVRAEQEARRLAAVAAAAAAKSKAEAEAKARAENEARRVAAAARAKAEDDEKAKADAEAKSRAELEARRVAAAAVAKAKVEAEAKQKAEADAKAASAAVAVAAAAAARAEKARQVAAAKAQTEARRVADAAKAVSDRQAAEAARITKAKVEQERRAAENAKRATEAAVAKAAVDKAAAEKAAAAKAAAAKAAADKPALSKAGSKVGAPVAVASRARVQRTVRPAKRLAGTGSSRQMGSAGGKLKHAKVAIKRVCPGVCRQVAGKRVKQGGWYVVQRGDSLWHIARMHYGNGNRYRFLRKVNRSQLGMSNVIYPCQRIAIPRVSR